VASYFGNLARHQVGGNPEGSFQEDTFVLRC